MFFVDYKPEPPAWGKYIRPLFNVPQLDGQKFLRPPIKFNNDDSLKIELLFNGLVEKFTTPLIPSTPEAKDRMKVLMTELYKGIWEGFSKYK